LLVGIVGSPNKGKSTLFSAMTMLDVPIADYPFTTIDPNLGVAYATKECAEKGLDLKCKARNSLCVNGIRMIPVNVVDVAGLVEGAHAGKGRGNQFLNDLSAADVLIIVVDISGLTDQNGNQSTESDPSNDITMTINEISEWVADIIEKNSKKSRMKSKIDMLTTALSGMKISSDQIEFAVKNSNLSLTSEWDHDQMILFAKELIKKSKKIVIAANKIDLIKSDEKLEKLRKKFPEFDIIGCSAAIELALKKAAKSGIIDYFPGNKSFDIKNIDINADQKRALEYMKKFVDKNKGTGVQNIINKAVFGVMDCIVVYPVEDESKYSDHFGNVLPDAVLIKKGSTAHDLAEIIHTDIAKGMLYALDARTKMRIGKEYVLKDGDIVKIVSAAK
jgi:ribosome-binding ATPase